MTDLMVQTVRRLKPVFTPAGIRSIQAFLTYHCSFGCVHCTNDLVARKTPRHLMSGAQWVEALGRLENGAPVTLRGGEPSSHPDFFDILEMLPAKVPLKLVTNLSFDPADLVGRLDPERINRHPSWAPIRVAFHLGKSDPEEILGKVMVLEEAGFRIGLLGMALPDQQDALQKIQKWFLSWGVDFRIRTFVGYLDGKLTGTFRYPDASGQQTPRAAACRTTELNIAPDGRIYHCRRDCFAETGAVGHVLDNALELTSRHNPCRNYGLCHPCDVELRPTVFRGSQRTAMEILPLD